MKLRTLLTIPAACMLAVASPWAISPALAASDADLTQLREQIKELREGYEARLRALGVGGDRVQPRIVPQPLPQDRAVQQRFLGAEGLGNQDGRSASGIQRRQHALRSGAILRPWEFPRLYVLLRYVALPVGLALTLVSVIVILTVLQFMPALVLGPVADHLMLWAR